jgi:hypothetical protein
MSEHRQNIFIKLLFVCFNYRKVNYRKVLFIIITNIGLKFSNIVEVFSVPKHIAFYASTSFVTKYKSYSIF